MKGRLKDKTLKKDNSKSLIFNSNNIHVSRDRTKEKEQNLVSYVTPQQRDILHIISTLESIKNILYL